MSSNVHLQKYIVHLQRYFTSEDQEDKYNSILSLEQPRMNKSNEQELLKLLKPWASVVFTSITVRVRRRLSYFNNLFFSKEWWRILILKYTSLHVKICLIRVKSAGHRTVSGWSLTTPAGDRTVPGRSSTGVIINRRRPASVRNDTTQGKILKNRPVPGRLSYSPVMCKSLKSYDVSFICNHSIIVLICQTLNVRMLVLFIAELSDNVLVWLSTCIWISSCFLR